MTVSSFAIRTFEYPRDLPAVIALWQQAGGGIGLGRSDTEDELVKKLQRDPELFLVAELDGDPVGAVLGGYDGRRGIVYHLAVASGHRGQGIGDALMAELERRLSSLGCLRSYLLVTPGNDRASEFYEKRGWEKMPHQIFGKDLA